MKIKDTLDRSPLSEGRSYQMGFAFLKKEKEYYETVNPVSPCKDYLNDIVWTEETGNPSRACGLQYEKKGIFTDKNCYLVAKMMCSKYGYFNYPEEKRKADEKHMLENVQNIQKVINDIEKFLEVEGKTEISVVDNSLLIVGPKFWRSSTYLISLYTLLIRTAQFSDGTPTMEFLKNFKHPLDMNLIGPVVKKLDALPKAKDWKQDLNEYKTAPHGVGILHYISNLK